MTLVAMPYNYDFAGRVFVGASASPSVVLVTGSDESDRSRCVLHFSEHRSNTSTRVRVWGERANRAPLHSHRPAHFSSIDGGA